MKNKGLIVLVSILLSGCVLCVNKAFFAQSSRMREAPINIVPNSGFEDDVDENGIPDGWKIWGYGDRDINSRGHDNENGTRSLKISTDNGTYIKFSLEDDMYVEVDPEFKYKLSYYAKGSASGFNLSWIEYDENYVETFIYYRGIRQAYRQNELTEDWQLIGDGLDEAGNEDEYDGIEILPVDRTKYVKFYGIVDNGTVWIDDLSAVAITRARILHTVIYDFETFTVDLQTGGEYNVADVDVELELIKDNSTIAYKAISGSERSSSECPDNYSCEFPAAGDFINNGGSQWGVGEYQILARFKYDDDRTVFYKEFPVYVVEQPVRTEGGVFRAKNLNNETLEPYFPVWFAPTFLKDGALLKSKGIYDLSAGSYEKMVDPANDWIAEERMHAPVFIDYKLAYTDPTYLTTQPNHLVNTHNKPSLLWWLFEDEPFWEIYKDPYELILASDMIKAYYTIRTTFDGENYEAIPLLVSEEVLYPNPSSNSYPDDRTREDIIAYTNAADIVMDDEYSYSRGWPLSRVAEDMEVLTKYSRGVKPTMIWLSCGWTVGIYGGIQQPKMTPEIFRAQTYLALIHGAKGVGYYSFYESVADKNPGWFLPRNNPALWAFMGDFMQELNIVKDIFLRGQDSDAVTVTMVDNATDEFGRAAAHYSVKIYKKQDNATETYVFIANSIDEDIEATIDGPGMGDSLTIDMPPYGTVFLVAKDNACPAGTTEYPGGVLDPDTWCAFDKDNDSMPDFVDNCLSVSNLNQDDTDEDGLGDLCDACNDYSSCCDYTDTAKNHQIVGHAGWGWTPDVVDTFFYANNYSFDWEDDVFCVEDDCSDDNSYTLNWSPGDDPVYYYKGACSSEDLVNCSDGIDNDNDYRIDCDDTDCENRPECSTDTDGDGIVDAHDCNDNDNSTYQLSSGYLDSDNDGIGSGSVVDVCFGENLPAGY